MVETFVILFARPAIFFVRTIEIEENFLFGCFFSFFFQAKSDANYHRTGLSDISYMSAICRDWKDIKKCPKTSRRREKPLQVL